MNDLLFELNLLYKAAYPDKIMTDPIQAIKEIKEKFDEKKENLIDIKAIEIESVFEELDREFDFLCSSTKQDVYNLLYR